MQTKRCITMVMRQGIDMAKNSIGIGRMNIFIALILLILCQSFSVTKKSLILATQNSSSQSVMHIHKHADDEQLVAFEKLISEDCIEMHNHTECGHCHSSHIHWLGQSIATCFVANTQSHTFLYLKTAFKVLLERLLRPPKT